MTERYLGEVRRWLVGPPHERDEQLRELAAHLREAEAAGDLEATLSRLGSPREAAAAFSRLAQASPATLHARVAAALLDYLPLVAATAAVALFDVSDGGSIMISFPTGLRLDGEWALWRNLVTPLGLIWSVLGVAFLEARNGQTPGKTLVGIQTVSDDGTAVTLRQAICRRAPLLFGPFLWLDAIAALFTERRRRVFDLVAHTRVISVPEAVRTNERPVRHPVGA